MLWYLSHRADGFCRYLADRHYSRETPGTKQFVPPGRCLVLYAETKTGRAYWVTSWPFAQYIKHRWAGAWMCSAFRNEGAGISSDLIRQAVSATRSVMGEPPELGMVTFVDSKKVKPTKVRGKDIWGWTFIKAGFEPCGETQGGLLAFQLSPSAMPDPAPPRPPALSPEGQSYWMKELA